jgi:hypothetical protein
VVAAEAPVRCSRRRCPGAGADRGGRSAAARRGTWFKASEITTASRYPAAAGRVVHRVAVRAASGVAGVHQGEVPVQQLGDGDVTAQLGTRSGTSSNPLRYKPTNDILCETRCPNSRRTPGEAHVVLGGLGPGCAAASRLGMSMLSA